MNIFSLINKYRILQDEKIVENCKNTIAPYLAKRWSELGEHKLVGEARIAGMLGALELVPDKSKRAFFEDRGKVGTLCRNIALKNGLILRSTNDSLLLSPPLVINHHEIDELFDKAWMSLNDTAKAIA